MTLTLTIKNQIKVPYLDESFDDFLYDALVMTDPKWLENERIKGSKKISFQYRYNNKYVHIEPPKTKEGTPLLVFPTRFTPKDGKFYFCRIFEPRHPKTIIHNETKYNLAYSYLRIPPKLYFLDEVGEDALFVPRGFLKNIIEYCNENQIELEIDNQTHIFEDISFEFSGTLRPFQETAVEKQLPENEGVLCAPTGSGKTVIGIYMIAKRKQPTLIIVHTRELLDQWTDRIKTFLNIPEKNIGHIGNGCLDEDKPITIALIQTLNKHPEIVNNYGFLIIDECHRTPSRTFTAAVKNFEGRYILGLSATPYRRDGLSKIIEWYSGPIRHKIEPRDLINTGHITSVEAVIRKTNFIASMDDPSAEYSTMLQEISQNEERNQMIIDDVWKAAGQGETCLILSDRKAHCHELKKLMGNLWNTEILTGDTPTKERKQIVKDTNAGKIEVLIATSQLIGEGFDCKELSVLFLTMPIRFSGRVIQYLGRVLRPAKGKERALVFDYFDQNVKCLYPGMKTRKKEYEKLKM